MRAIACAIVGVSLIACGGTVRKDVVTPPVAQPSPTSPRAIEPTPPPQPSPRTVAEPSAPAPAPVPVVPPPATEITIAAVGDIMLGSTFPHGKQLPPKDGAHILQGVSKTLRAVDLAFGNLEGPMLEGGRSPKCARMKQRAGKRKTCYAFRMPTRYAKYLAEAGFDMLSLSNNHAMDFGLEGREITKATLDKHGIAHASAPGTIAERTVKGVKVGMLSFATAWHSNDLRKIDEAVATVKAAAARYPILMVSFHGGAEGFGAQRVPRGTEYFLGENRGDLRRFARAVIDAGADIVLGHGPHVVRGMEVYKDRLIAYSLGNFATYSFIMSGAYGISYILEARLSSEGKFLSGVIHPTMQSQVRGTNPDRRGRVIGVLRRLSRADFGKSAVVISADGRFSAPTAP